MSDAGSTDHADEETARLNDAESTARDALHALTRALSMLDDSAFSRVVSQEAVVGLLKALLDPGRVSEFQNAAEFLLHNKCRATFIAALRLSLTGSYAIRFDRSDGPPMFVSPFQCQWFDDGVMFLEGTEPFTGAIGVYREGHVYYAIARREALAGDTLGVDDFEFVGVDRLAANSELDGDELRRAEPELLKLLSSGCPDEAEYQSFLQRHPWVFGAQHERFTRHDTLSESDIPDFTAVRTKDKALDIFELKQPFLPLFRRKGGFRSEFLQAWDQAERYLDFARSNGDYLWREKGLRFDRPRCYLVIGYRLEPSELAAVRRKQRSNSAIEIFTYDDILAQLRGTVLVIERLASPQPDSRNLSGSDDMRVMAPQRPYDTD